MKQLVSLEIYHIVRELQVLLGGKVSKVYQPDDKEIVIDFHKTGLGKRLLRIIPGLAIYLTTKKRPNPDAQLGFSKLLRKRLTNTRIESITQKDFERIVELKFKSKEGSYILIAEFLPNGTLILCHPDYKIISALEYQKWRDRKLLPNQPYVYPPSKSLNPLDITEEGLSNAIKDMERSSLVKFLAIELSLGGKYSEYLCKEADLDKDSKSLSAEEVYRLSIKLKEMLAAAYPSLKEDDAFLFSGRINSFNDALDEYYGKYIEHEDLQEKETSYNKKLSQLTNILKMQKEQLESAERSLIEDKKKGDLIYSHYHKIKEIMEAIKLARSKKISWQEIATKLKPNGIDVSE